MAYWYAIRTEFCVTDNDNVSDCMFLWIEYVFIC